MNLLIGESSPHMHASRTTSGIMREVLFAMVPILIFSTLYFGIRSLILTAISVLTAMVCEYLWTRLRHLPNTLWDFSAVVTGMLLAFNLPSSAPWWLPVVGSAFAIIVVKELFGGIGHNFVNPALAGRCFLLVSFPALMMSFKVDGVSVATPLSYLESGDFTSVPSYMSCFLGVIPGSLGETSKILILLGGIYLIARGIIDFRIPLGYLGTLFILSYCFGGNGLYEILTGGAMLGAFFMATDYTTSPMSKRGRLIYGIGCGLMTALIRFFGSYPEGASFSILLMNLATPLIDRVVVPRVYGTRTTDVKERAKKDPWLRGRLNEGRQQALMADENGGEADKTVEVKETEHESR